MTDLLQDLCQRLDERTADLTELRNYYDGKQPLTFLSPEAKAALGSRFGRMASNLPRLAVTALAERLRVIAFHRDGKADPALWADWIRNDLDQNAGVTHREALALRSSYVIVWADAAGDPKVTVESPKQVVVQTDPGTRRIVAAVKRWETTTTTEAVLYGPDEIVRYRANTVGATTAGFRTVETIANPLGQVPVVRFRNDDLLLGDGVSEIDDLKPLVDGLNKALADMMVSSEYAGRPRRTATGIEPDERPVLNEDGSPKLDDDGEPLTEAVSPFPEANRMMVTENADAKIGQLPSADLGSYENAVKVLLGQIMAVSALPAHYVGVFTDNPASADALRASEASLTARAEARQATFGRSWEDVARLVVAVREGRDPAAVDVRVRWADAATRSVAQEADAVVKMHAAGLLPASYALARLGYTEDEITAIRTARRTEAIDGAGIDLSRLLPTSSVRPNGSGQGAAS